ncbi:MAG TPA: hypothetical protein VFF38_07625, partial [Microvirga sp.]|nr:hypothetical protein [Microvirga sp.]
MNKKENEHVHQAIASTGLPVLRSSKKAGRAKQARGRQGPAARAAGPDALPWEAQRLLAVLDTAETRVLVDPTDVGSVI